MYTRIIVELHFTLVHSSPRNIERDITHTFSPIMMKWHLDQMVGLSTISKRFGGVDDEDLLILLSRLKELEEAYRWEYSFLWMM